MSNRPGSVAAGPARARVTPFSGARLRGLGTSRLAWAVLVLLVIAMAVLVFRETRGTTLWWDDWLWATERRGGGIDAYLEPHNQHLSLVPAVIYKLLFATAGVDDYTPWRLVVIAGHALVAALLFGYARRRVGDGVALLAAALFLFFGPGWQNFMWGFQIAWLIAVAAGVGALLLLERRDRVGDTLACVLVGLGLASAGVGVPVALGVAADVVLTRRRLRDLWIAAAPVALYGVWWLAYQDPSDFTWHSVARAPAFVADAVGATLSSLVGLGVSTASNPRPAPLVWAAPLAILATGVVVWRLRRLGRISPRAASLLVVLGSFWLLTALSRAELSSPQTSRYLYVGALFGLLFACEIARGTRPGPRILVALSALTAIAVVANAGVIRDAGRLLRGDAQTAVAAVGAFEIAAPVVDPEYGSAQLPGYPFVVVTAAEYFDLARDAGPPAASPAEIAAAPEPVRRATDAELTRIHRIGLPPAPPPGRGAAPVLEGAAGGTATRAGSCLVFRGPPFVPRGQERWVDVTVPSGGLVVEAVTGDARVALRRFAAGYGADQELGRVRAGAAALLSIRRDRAAQPWHLRVSPEQGARVCSA